MLINKTFETPEGTVTFEGTLEEKELDLVLQLGLNVLLVNGAFKLSGLNDEEDPTPKNIQ